MRKAGLMNALDRLRFFLHRLRNKSKNEKFIKAHPGIKLPPDYTLYESYRLDYSNYYDNRKNTAQWLAKELSINLPTEPKKILDWGCGPARVVRHLPDHLQDADIYATDYNEQTIQWCRENIPDVKFSVNSIEPPLNFPDIFFDAIYGLSVFTHLSEKNHFTWVKELFRILKPGGILLITTQGQAFTDKLTSKEKEIFAQGEIVVRGKVKEGHRTYSAFHPEKFMLNLFSDHWKMLKFLKGTAEDYGPEQDLWIIQKR